MSAAYVQIEANWDVQLCVLFDGKSPPEFDKILLINRNVSPGLLNKVTVDQTELRCVQRLIAVNMLKKTPTHLSSLWVHNEKESLPYGQCTGFNCVDFLWDRE